MTRGVLPELRRHHPFSALRRPVLEMAEARVFDATMAAQDRWFETATVVLNRLQAFLFGPVTVLCIMQQSADALHAHGWSPWCVQMLSTVCGRGDPRRALTDTAHPWWLRTDHHPPWRARAG